MILFSLFVKLSCDSRFQRAFTAWGCAFKEITFEVKSDYTIQCIDLNKFVRGCHPLVKVEEDKELKVKNYATIDIETCWYENNNIKVYLPYAIGVYYMGKYKSFYVTNYSSVSGSMYGNAINMVSDLYKYIKENKIKILYAHNGGKFDYKILLSLGNLRLVNDNTKLNSEAIITKSMIKGITIYSLNIKYKNHIFTLKDSYLLLGRSLSELCKAFNISSNNIKGYLPHEWITLSKLEYVGDKPDIKYFENISAEEYENISNVYNFKKECNKYLERDCISLYEILYSFQNTIYMI